MIQKIKNIDELGEVYLDMLIEPHMAMTVSKFRSLTMNTARKLNLEISFGQLVLLQILNDTDGMTQQELTNFLHKTKSNISRMLEPLAKKGYVEIKVELRNKKVVRKLCITKKGSSIAEKYSNIGLKVNQLGVSDFSQEEIDHLKFTLKRIRNNLDKEFII
jgi:DNA-binding MarR family transcriptional regulator